jgi:hypothetical protein
MTRVQHMEAAPLGATRFIKMACDIKCSGTEVTMYEIESKNSSDEQETPQWLGWESNRKAASSLLVKLLDAFSEPEFQAQLQTLIMAARKSEHSKQPKVVPGRAALIRKAREAVFSEFEMMCEARMCKMIAPCVADEEISYQLAIIDELLALSPNASMDYVKLVCDYQDSTNKTTKTTSSLAFTRLSDHLAFYGKASERSEKLDW